MSQKILISGLLFFLMIAVMKAQVGRYAPGQIVIKYEKTGQRARGSEILTEHQNFVDNLKLNMKGLKIKSYSPVFNGIIKDMIDKNYTEQEVTEKKTFSKKNKSVLSLLKKTTFSNILLLKIDSLDDIEEVATRINNNPNIVASQGIRIVYAEPNYLKRTNIGSNDPLYSLQWSHKITNMGNAWDTTQGSPDIKIAIIDTGVDPTHPDLMDNLQAGYNFVDIDTNYYKQYSYYTLLPGEIYTQPGNNCTDYNGHGTHCAGIAAAGDNGIGVIGVAPKCKIMPVRAGFSILIGGQETGVFETTAIVQAINYAVDNGANVISMSFGGDSSSVEKEAIQNAYYNNVVIVAAAGNSASTVKPYPAGYNEVLAITSIDSTRARSFYSNYGLWTSVAAPGENIISTVPLTGGDNSDPSGYKVLSGTSMATPYIAGVAALVLSHSPSMSNNLVYQTIRSSVNSYYSSDYYIGTGIVDGSKIFTGAEACISKITSPHNISNVYISQGSIDISGRASGKYFSKYSFEYSDYQNSNPVWQALGQNYTTPVDSGYLGTVNITQNGVYYIRLKVRSSINVDYTDIIGPVTVDKRLRANWPVSTGYQIGSTPVLSDIDGDGNVETIFTSSNGGIYVVNKNGNNIPGWPVIIPDDYQAAQAEIGFCSPAVGDFDNDGKEEIVVRDGRFIYMYNKDGIIRSGWPVSLATDRTNIFAGNAMVGSPTIADINNDGYKEILVTFRDGKIFAFDRNGQNMPGWPITVPTDILHSTPVVSDLDCDGNIEIIIQGIDATSSDSKGYLFAFDNSGNILSGWPQTIGGGSWTSPITADINNDGQNEIIAASYSSGSMGVYAFHKEGNLLNGFPIISGDVAYGYYDITAGLSAGDINNDGYKEILIASTQYLYSVFAITRNGEILWATSQGYPYNFNMTSVPVIADINNDGKPEILVSKYNSSNNTGKILVVDNTGHEIQSLSCVIPEEIWATPSIGDIEANNKLELICGTTKGELFCWDLDAANNSSKSIWPTYQQNYQRTGSIELLRNIASITQLVEPANNAVNQPGKITFKWNPVQGALKYHFQLSDSSSFNNIVFEDTLLSEVYCFVDSVRNSSNGLKEATKYFWRVSAKNLTGESTFSEVWTFITLLNAPDSLITSVIGIHKIKLAWKDSSASIAGFKIERKFSDKYVLIDSVGIGMTSYIDTSLTTLGTYHYKVYAYTSNAQSSYSNESTVLLTGINDRSSIPTEYLIHQNYPNPFNPTTVIEYGLPVQSQVKIVVYNILGEVVKELENTVQSAGYHNANFGGNNISSGVYFYKLEAKALDGSKQFREIKKMMLLK
jgi:thermitase